MYVCIYMYIHTYTHTHTHEGLCTYFNDFTVITFSVTDTPKTMTRVPDLLTLLTLRALFLCGNFLFFFSVCLLKALNATTPKRSDWY